MVKVAVCKKGTDKGGKERNLKLKEFHFFKRLLEISVIFKCKAAEQTTWVRLGIALPSFYMNESSHIYSQIPTKLGFDFIF